MSIIDNLYKNKFKLFSIFLLLIALFLLRKFKIIEGFAPNDYSMGEYSNLVLKPKGCSDWRKPPAYNKLLKGNIFTPFGTQVPLKNNYTKSINDGPPIDGNSEDNRKDLFMFAYNKSSPDCCPSTYSTSTGCICTTKNQRDYINQRGNNSIKKSKE